ncbi:nuclear transport factor 2 family protein [Arthrobacter nitrophenolicus]|jgi:hypothetical protein|uniref:Uncharacterized protein n=2 Tax=Arthrobacter nitrophenolicus TaxID=683150 RepID=A0ACC6TL41_9MICC|nr:nuclear transport factor 2 family protein [Arthrobacter nitrophenolicus]ELT42702.1 hypothetical protein G205_22862 [Arthrobacter nitrophenolicus]
MDDHDLLVQLKAERDIARVVTLAARASDRKDFEMRRACFHPDAVEDHGHFSGTIDDSIAFLEPHHENYDMFLHFIATPSIEVEGKRAYAETYAIVVTQLKQHQVYTLSASPSAMIGCRFLDEFEERDGVWKIAKRTVAFEWSKTDWTTPPKAPGAPGSTGAQPSRSSEDFVYGLGDGILVKAPGNRA